MRRTSRRGHSVTHRWSVTANAPGCPPGVPMFANILTRATMPLVLGATLLAMANTAAAATTTVTISGTPPTTATVGQSYNFQPTATSSRYGSRLRYSISGKPAWAYFSSYRGTLYGVPGTKNVGTYSNIVISVSDGRRTARLAPFAITVVWARRPRLRLLRRTPRRPSRARRSRR